MAEAADRSSVAAWVEVAAAAVGAEAAVAEVAARPAVAREGGRPAAEPAEASRAGVVADWLR